jgi:hypothetical protein
LVAVVVEDISEVVAMVVEANTEVVVLVVEEEFTELLAVML